MSPNKLNAILDGTYDGKKFKKGILPTTPVDRSCENAKLANSLDNLGNLKPSESTPAIPLHSMQLLPMF